jgi:hypothetical protein
MNLLEKIKSLFKRKVDISVVDEYDEFYNPTASLSDSEKAIAKSYADDHLPRHAHELDGLYFSKVTGRIFEAEVLAGRVFIQYADEQSPKNLKLPYWIFEIQALDFNCYEPLINYKEAIQ